MQEAPAFRFSVVIATYNRREMVQESIRSVLEQTYPAHQIIVVVDGSSDGTADAVRSRFPNVEVFEQPNLGPSIAHNSGIALANGDWVCFLDDDDIWHREKLEATARYLSEHPDCLAVRNPIWFFADHEDGPQGCFGFKRDFVAADSAGCHAAIEKMDATVGPNHYLAIEGNSHAMMLERNRGALSATVVHRQTLIRAGGFCPMQTCGDDWTMFLNVSRLCEWHLIPRKLGFSRLHGTQNTGDARNGIYTLVGYLNAWFTGRPLKRRASAADVRQELSKYSRIYREMVQGYIWSAITRGQFKAAATMRSVGLLLLPRWVDRVYVHVPPQITWRWERYVLGMHK